MTSAIRCRCGHLIIGRSFRLLSWRIRWHNRRTHGQPRWVNDAITTDQGRAAVKAWASTRT